MRDSFRFLLPLAVLAAAVSFGTLEGGPAGIETIFLGKVATAVLLAVAALAPDPAFELGAGSALAVTALWALPAGSSRGAAVLFLLVAAFSVAAVRRLARTLRELPDLPFEVAIPLALGAQFLLRSELLFEPVGLRTLIALLALPVAGGAAAAILARRHGGSLTLLAAGIALLFGPGWNVATTVGVIAVAVVGVVLKSNLRLRLALLPLGILLAATALLDSYPWRREQPVLAALHLFRDAPGLLATPGDLLLPPETSVSLDAEHPFREKDLPPGPVSALILDSALSNGAGLADGTPVAVMRLTDESGRSVERTVRAGSRTGSDTGEWAARRGDVVHSARLHSPEPWMSWMAEGFFAQRYRLRWDLPVPGRFTRLRIERSPDLSPEVELAVHQVEIRRLRGLPLGPDDPFRGTLLALPLILAGLALIQRMAVRRGAPRLSSSGTAGELAAAGVLVLLILGRTHLSLGWSDEILAAGLALVLAHRLARQTAALRPLLGERLPDRPSAVFFLLPLVAYLAILPWSTAHRQPDGDEPYNLLITHSLAYDFDADLTNNYAQGDWQRFMDRPLQPQPGDPVGTGGELYSRHNEALPLVLAPAYRLAGKAGALAMMAAFAAALAWATLRLGRRYFPDNTGHPGAALAAWALCAFAPPLLLYSYQVWVEVPATLLLVVALDRILGFDVRRGHPDWDRADWLEVGLPVLLLPLVKMRFMLLAGPLLAMAWWYSGRPRKPILILAGLLSVLGAGILVYNQMVYANPLKIHSWQEIDPHRHTWLSYVTGGLGLFWDAAFGLFGCAPVWMLLLPAVVLLLARRHRLPAHLAVLSAPYLVIVAPRLEWYGGWSPPFRYALVALPLLALALVPLLAARRGPGARALIAGLGALTLAVTLLWLVVPGWTYSFANGRTYPIDHLSARLGTDLERFFPSMVRFRPATWIWPPVSFALVSLLWWLPFRRKMKSGEGAALAGMAGVAAVIAMAALLPLAAARLPTRTVEMEDSQVWKSGGHVHPDLWIIERTRWRGGWVLRVGETLKAPVVPGGKRVTLVLNGELVRNQPVPFHVDVRAGDRLLAIWTPVRNRAWGRIVLGPFDWPAGAPLAFSAYGPHPPGALNGAILDRVEMRWE